MLRGLACKPVADGYENHAVVGEVGKRAEDGGLLCKVAWAWKRRGLRAGASAPGLRPACRLTQTLRRAACVDSVRCSTIEQLQEIGPLNKFNKIKNLANKRALHPETAGAASHI